MGIDFVKLIGNLGITAASMQNDKSKIDTKTELNTYVSGWDAIKAKAKSENVNSTDTEKVDISSLENEMKSELTTLMGAEFGEASGVKNKETAKEPFFNEEDISLENMMALLSPEDGLDISKLREENKKPMLSTGEKDVATMNDFGFDPELTDIIMNEVPGAVKYISDAIKTGSADRITDDITQTETDQTAAKNILDALKNIGL